MRTRGRAGNTERVWAWRPARTLLVVCMFAGLPPRARARGPRAQGDRHRQRSRSHRDHRARRGLRGARRHPAGRDRAGRPTASAAACPCGRRRPAPTRHGSCSRSPTPPTRPSSAGSPPTATAWSARASCGPTSTRAASMPSRRRSAYVPERIKNDRADVFRLTLEPGQTVTFVAELASDRFARLYPVEAASSTSRRAATASSSTASCWASPACSPSS